MDNEPALHPPPAGRENREFRYRAEWIWIIAGLMALNAMAIDIMLPALDEIAAATGLGQNTPHDNRQQLVIFAYVLGFGAPQLIWGPVTDRYGRRAPLFISLAGYILTALICILVQNFWMLLAARFLQGIFASGARTVAAAAVRDLFRGREMARFMSMVMTIFMIVPIMAPALGQIVLLIMPWQGIFLALAGWGLVMLAWTWFRLPETLPPERRMPLHLPAIRSAYLQILQTRTALGYMLASGVIFSGLFAFIASSEQILGDVFNQDDSFALWFALIAAALALSNLANARLVGRLGMHRLSHIALLIFTATCLLLTLLTLAFGDQLGLFIPLFTIAFACFGMMGSNFSAIAMESLGAVAGTASAAYGFATTMISSLLGIIIGAQFDGSSVPLTAGLAILGLLTLLIILITEKNRLFTGPDEA